MQQYGEVPKDELLHQTGTIPQALLRMNGRFTRDLSKTELLSSPALILSYSGSSESIVENSFLICLTRYPTAEEQKEFVRRIAGATVADNGDQEETRKSSMEDLFWVLFNAPEFSWNH